MIDLNELERDIVDAEARRSDACSVIPNWRLRALVRAVRASWHLADVRSGDYSDDELMEAYSEWDTAMKAIYGGDA